MGLAVNKTHSRSNNYRSQKRHDKRYGEQTNYSGLSSSKPDFRRGKPYHNWETTTTAHKIIAHLDKLKSSAFLVSQWQTFIPYLRKYLTVLCTSSKAGCISNHFSAWTGITSDKEILSDIRGMAVELSELPVQYHFVPTKFNSAETAIIEQEINKMIKKGTIEKVLHEKHEII